MTDSLRAVLNASETPVILLEGTRKLPVEDHARLETVATRLFHDFPHAIFRSGNAEGGASPLLGL